MILNAQDVTITNSDFNENSLNGIWAFNMTKFTMENCHCDDNTPGTLSALIDQTTYGAAVTGKSADVIIRKCTFNHNTSTGFAAGFNSGFAAQNASTTNILFDSCQFNDNSVTLSDQAIADFLATHGGAISQGIEMTNATNVTFNNCEAHGSSLTLNVSLSPEGFPPVTAFITTEVFGFLINFSFNLTMTNCSSSGLTFQNNSKVGARNFTESFEIKFANKFYLSNCHAYGNTNSYNDASTPSPTNPSLLVVEGFDFESSQNGVVEDCTSGGHTQAAANPVEGQFSFAAGFNAHIAFCANCYTIVFRRCVATGNVDTGTFLSVDLPFGGGSAFGFCTREPQFAGTSTGPNSSIYVFESCIAESNTTNYGTGYGFDIFNLTDSKIINCFAEGNNIGINVSDFTLPPATNEFGSANNIFRGNVVSANTAFGIQDTTTAKSNAYYSNQAKNNGPTPATTNYSGAGIFPVPSCSTTTLCCTPANLTPVLYWTLPNAPCTLNTNCVVSTPLDNLSIVN